MYFKLVSTILIALSFCVQTGFTKEQHREAAAVRVPAQKLAKVKMPTPLSLKLPAAFVKGKNIFNLGFLSKERIALADKAAVSKEKNIAPPVRIGLVRSVGPLPLSIKRGSALSMTVPEGRKLWTLAIQSPGAFGLRIHFRHFDVGEGSVLVYGKDSKGTTVRGPFTDRGPDGSGDFWTASLPGDTAYIECSGSSEPKFEIGEVLHYDKAIGGAAPGEGEAGALDPLSCEVDVMCESVNTLARDAVGWISFITSGGLAFFCSGTLLNDLDDDTLVPFLLTAYHCGIRSNNVNTIEVVYLFQSSSCGGSLPNFTSLPNSIGGTILKSSNSSDGNDMTFIRLNGELPPGVGLAGWNTDSSGDTLFGIHHPGGDFKRVTRESSVGACPGCPGCGDVYDYDFYDIDKGVLEPGSSGSGLFNSSGQLVGQLKGDCCIGCSGTLGCSNKDDFVAVYGEFETTYELIETWLEIGGTIHVDASTVFPIGIGTSDSPFKTVGEAHNFAWRGARIKIKAGHYPEKLTLSKQVTILGTGGPVFIGK